MIISSPSANIGKGCHKVRGAAHSFILFTLLYSVILAMSACSSSGNNSGAETGAIAFTLRFPGDQIPTKAIVAEEGTISAHCSEYGIARVEVEVFDENNVLIATGGPWDCSAGEGIIEGVRMGDGISLIARLRNSAGKAILLGSKSGITVISGETSYTGPVDIILAEENRAPAAVNDTATVIQGGTINLLDSGAGSLLANDSDPDGLMLRVNTRPVEAPSHGRLTLNADGTFAYENTDAAGTADRFVYEVQDVFGNVAAATVAINITNNTPANQAPAIRDGGVTPAGGNTSTTFTFSARYTDPDNDIPADRNVVIDGNPYTMILGLNQAAADGIYTYSTMLSTGSHTYSFSFSDGNGHTATLSPDVSIPVTDPPVIEPPMPGEARSPYGSVAMNVRTAMDIDGNAIAVWEQGDETGRSQIFMSEYRDGAWRDPQNLSDHISLNDFDSQSPQVAMDDNGNAIITWSQDGGIFKSEYRDGAWTHPASIEERLNPTSASYAAVAESPQVAMDNNGNAIIVWSQDGSIYMSEYRDRDGDGMGEWVNPDNTEVSFNPFTGSEDADSPQVAMNDNGDAIVVWRQRARIDRNIQIFTREFTDGGWRRSSDIMSPDGSDAQCPQVARDNIGNIVVTWLQPDETHMNDDGSTYNTLQVFKSDYRQHDGTWSWSKPGCLSGHISPDGWDCNSDEEYGSPQVAMDNLGNSIIVWNQGAWIFKSEYRNGLWTDPRDLSDYLSAEGTALCPQVSMGDNGNAVITWCQYELGAEMLFSVFKSEYRNSAWTEPANLISKMNINEGFSFGLNSSMNDFGSTLIAWLQFENITDLGYHLFKSEYGEGTWDEASNLTDSVAMAGPNILDTQIAMDRYGNAIVVWVQGIESAGIVSGTIFMSEKQNGVWTSPEDSSDCISTEGSNNASSPRVAMDDNGNALIAWTEQTDTGNQLFISQRSDGRWLPAQPVPGATRAYNPQVDMNNSGNAIIVWSENCAVSDNLMLGEYRLYKTEFMDGAWQPSEAVSLNVCGDQHEPRIAMNDTDDASIIWTEQMDGENLLNISRCIGGEWYPAGPVAGATNVSLPQVAMGSDGMTIILCIRDNREIIRYEFGSGGPVDPGADSGEPPYPVFDSPQVAMSRNGYSIIAWIQDDRIYWNTREPAEEDGSWSPTPNIIDMSDSLISSLQVAISDSGEAVIVWESGESYDNYLSRLEIRNGSSPEIFQHFNPYHGLWDTHTPKIAMDEQGNTVIVWSQYSEPVERVFETIYQ